ncbi:hypothetical protein HSBAA_56850 [Vreelandella sulfidaeris]|uniref:ABC transporter permease n=1 Tax=Vreelandella sulfidaeris TaxID=115553 RepID=A0A455UJG5_9GAMM|nr:hypothetical protein HSBAA_56850 [Halomonas sulfidaeris]
MAAFIAGVMIILMNSLVEQFGAGWTTVLLGIGASLLLGICAGFINGIVTTKGKIEAFIVTLGTMGIYRSLVTYLSDGGTLTLDWAVRDIYRPVYYGSFLGITIPVWVFLAVAVIGYILLNYTRFGRYCFAIGSNEKVAEYSAIHVDRVKTLTYMLQGVCVALATIIYVPRLGSASGATGVLWELEAIAAVIIGGTMLKGWTWAHLGHGGGRHHAHHDWQYSQFDRRHFQLSQRHGAGDHHHCGGLSAACIVEENRTINSLANSATSTTSSTQHNKYKHERSITMRTIKTAVKACVTTAAFASAIGLSGAAVAQEVTIGVSIPAATHGWTGGVNYHAEEAKNALRSSIPTLRSLSPRRAQLASKPMTWKI